jgi:hypothetical protein
MHRPTPETNWFPKPSSLKADIKPVYSKYDYHKNPN